MAANAQNQPHNKAVTMLYRAVSVDKGCDLAATCAQINRSADKRANCMDSTWLTFDIIGTSDQVASGFCHAVAAQVFTYISQRYPNALAVIIAVTDSNHIRPSYQLVSGQQPSTDNVHQFIVYRRG